MHWDERGSMWGADGFGGRVERVEVTFGNEIRTWCLNVTKEITDTLKEIGMNDLLKEETRLVNSLKM